MSAPEMAEGGGGKKHDKTPEDHRKSACSRSRNLLCEEMEHLSSGAEGG